MNSTIYSLFFFNKNHLFKSYFNLKDLPPFSRSVFKKIALILTHTPSTYQSFTHYIQNIMILIYCYKNIDKTIIIIVNKTYPKRLVNMLINELNNLLNNSLDEELDEGLDKIWERYRDIEEIDKVEQVNYQLTELKTDLVESIEQIIKRGEKIDELLDKTDKLGKLSKTFNVKTKRLNRCLCCPIV